MNDASIVPLQQLYLSALVALIDSHHLTAVQQDLGNDTGRLWMVSIGTTVPIGQIGYKFDDDSVALAAVMRDERKFGRIVRYIEGIDGFLEDFEKFMNAGKLAAPGKRKADPRGVLKSAA